MRVLALLAVDQLHEQGPLDMELGHLVQRRRRKNDLGAKVQLWPFAARRHDEGIASVVLVEALDDGSPANARHAV
jgi:hypothetical protein